MSYTLTLILSLSIFLPAITGAIRIKQAGKEYHPFIYCMYLGALNEVVSYIMIQRTGTSTFNNNVYVLLEAILLLWQFKEWGLFAGKEKMFWLLLLLIVSAWSTEIFFISGFGCISSYYRIFYSFILVLMSISFNNHLILTSRNNLLRNPRFMICIGIVIYFTYKILVEAFWLFGLNASREFRVNVYSLLSVINFVINLTYFLSLLWIPSKQRFTMPS